MHIKVYICGMEMSHSIYFWYQIVLKRIFFCFVFCFVSFFKWQKITFLFPVQPTKNNFELKMLKLLENYVKTV